MQWSAESMYQTGAGDNHDFRRAEGKRGAPHAVRRVRRCHTGGSAASYHGYAPGHVPGGRWSRNFVPLMQIKATTSDVRLGFLPTTDKYEGDDR